MLEPRKLHVVFVLPGIGRLAYHFTTLQHLAETGHRVTFVSCRREVERSDATPRHLIELQDMLDAFESSHDNVTFLYEGKSRLNIRQVKGKRGKARSTNNAIYMLRSYSSYLRRLPESNFYVKRWSGFLPAELKPWADTAWHRRLLKSSAAYRMLTWLERRGPPEPGIAEWLRTVQANVVVASPTNTRNSLEADYLFAARKLGIPTAVPVMSWDNLTTKGLIPFDPDIVLAWNHEHAREAREIHEFPSSRIVITGSPFFDKWFECRQLLEDRPQFLRRLNLDVDRPFIIYLGSSKNIAENEGWLVKSLLREIRANPGLNSLQLVVRPHPGNPNMIEDLKGLNDVICLNSEIPFTNRSTGGLLNTLFHAVAAVGVNTTGMVDALALGTPCFSIKTDCYHDTHLQAAHFRHMVDADAISVAENVKALGISLNSLLEGRDNHKEQRQRFVADFLRPMGLHEPAGKIAAKSILLLAEGKKGPEITAALSAI